MSPEAPIFLGAIGPNRALLGGVVHRAILHVNSGKLTDSPRMFLSSLLTCISAS